MTLRSPVIDSHQDIIPTKTFGSGLPSQGTCETDQRSLCIIELIILFVFPYSVFPKMFEWANQNAFGNASICVWVGFQKAFPFISPQSDWLSVIFYTLLRKGESLWPWLDLGHLVSFNLLSIPPAQYLSSPPKNWVKFISLTNCLIDFHLCWKLYPHIKECINQQNIHLMFHYKAIFILPLQL